MKGTQGHGMSWTWFWDIHKPLRKNYKHQRRRGWFHLRLYTAVDRISVPKLLWHGS